MILAGISDNFDPVIGKFCVAEGDDGSALKDLLSKAHASGQRGDLKTSFEHQDKKGTAILHLRVTK